MTPFDARTATPREVVAELFRRLDAEEWSRAVELHHPDYVGQTAEALRQYRIREGSREYPVFWSVYEISGIRDSRTMPDDELFAALLECTDDRTSRRRRLEELAREHRDQVFVLRDQIRRLPSRWRFESPGEIVDGHRAWVLYDNNDPFASFSPGETIGVAILRRTVAGWKLTNGVMVYPDVDDRTRIELPDGSEVEV